MPPRRSFPARWLLLLLATAAPVCAAGEAGDGARAHLHWLDQAVLAAYFASVLLIGLVFRDHGAGSVKEYFRAENRIPPWAAGVSLMATRLSAVTLVSIPAKAFATNWTYLLLPFGNIAVAYVVARWVVPFYHRLDLTSIYEYLEARFGPGVRLLGSVSFLALETARLGVLILVPALVVTVVTDLNRYACILALGLVTTVSTALGGIKGVIWVNVLEAALLLGGTLVCLVIILLRLDQPLAGLAAAAGAGKLTLIEPSLDPTRPSLLIVGLYWIGEIKNYVANQTNAQRFIVTPDVATAQRSVWIGALSMVFVITLCMMLGTALHLYYAENPQRLVADMGNPDELLPWFIIREVPAGLAGLLLAAIFCSAMSSLNSALNSISSVVVKDIYQRYFPDRSDAAGVRLGRALVWVGGGLATLVGLLMAGYRIDSLFDQLTELLGLFGGPLGGAFLLGIFTTRANTRGLLVGYAGACAVLAWVKAATHIHLLGYMAIGLMTCFVLGYLSSWLLPEKPRDLRRLTVHTAGG